ncbi:hypothetical protein GCK72_002047 [Caenorhabditis remanei]|uniref:non-specific serine/threonine protein kinase n=1 Tax=Caenorhabditis remanei TaxID=31234 RepID=A0A6A5HRA2_CAERE|nr:hypothetical protein GCK72_002047 [Caenorhabditis remanei]KAF1770229.1 hypothetical protein GCK72_002047 [Caenorhabditis remanei]
MEIDTVGAPAYQLAIDVNEVDGECRTAMYLAVAEGHLEVVQAMTEFKCLSIDGKQRCPFQLDVYCTRGRTPFMLAAFNQNLPLMNLLLDAGADINLPLAVLDTEYSVEEGRCIGSGALVEAVRSDGLHVVHFLLDRGALDTDNKALRLAAQGKNEKLIRVFLVRLVFADPEYKINKKNIDVGQIQVGQSLLPSSLCPSKAAQLNWNSANLENLQSDWFVAAALHVNPRLRTTRLSLAAITRVDLSDNRLTTFPSILFQMPSLRSLNIADNSIRTIEIPTYYISSTSLEILNLRNNQLECLTIQFLSSLPQLQQLDVSKNELSQLPEYIWLCPSLKELNASHNRLSALPMVARASRGERPRLQSSNNNSNTQSPSHETNPIVVDDPPNVTTNPLRRQNVWQASINLSKVDDDSLFPDFPVTSSNTLTTINLSFNKFHTFPFCLACTCPRLLILNMSNNSMTSLPPMTCVPAHLRTLDLSYNKIQESFVEATPLHIVCHAVPPTTANGSMLPKRRNSPARQHRSRSKSAVRSQRSLSVSRHHTVIDSQKEEECVHKRHDSLEWLKTLQLAGNRLRTITVSTAAKVLLPALNVLDLSDNKLLQASPDIAKLSLLSMLNLSGNTAIKELPPDYGMLSRLWSLSLKGCSLKEPLESMVNVENCKTVEIVAYLKTILEESKTYHHLRVMILGSDNVGKSTIWEALSKEAVQKRQPIQSETGVIRQAEWKFEAKRSKGDKNLGPVGFSVIDFGGQREYHSTHQYFLSKRSLNLVLWKITDGDEAFAQLDTWLINIHARAPNSTVILVGTNLDQVASNSSKFGPGFVDIMEQKVRSRYMIADADKSGLPRVVDVILITSTTRNDVKALLNTIYRTAWEVRIGKERAMEQQIPYSYVALMKVTKEIAAEFRKEGQPAVMTVEAYKERVRKRMMSKYGRPFRDDIEFYGACTFLHDCGELVRFEDATLRDLIFVDPLWLAEFLTSIVILRSPNLPAGLLSTDAINPLTRSFKSGALAMLKTQLLDLLHKFELALATQPRQLLIPSLLPDEYRLRADFLTSAVKIRMKMAQWNVRCPSPAGSPTKSPLRRTSPTDLSLGESEDIMLQFTYDDDQLLRRIYALAYIPSGFWSRLVTRIMGDKNVCAAIESIFMTTSADRSKIADIATKHAKAEWVVWQTGIELHVKGHSLFTLKQFLPLAEIRDIDYSSLDMRAKDEQKRWRTWNKPSHRPIVEMVVNSLSISTASQHGRKLSMKTDVEGRSRLLALISDLLDTLLEDWYPALGTRFVHSSEGDLLVSRYVLCPHCIKDAERSASRNHVAVSHRRSQDDGEILVNSNSHMKGSRTTGDISKIHGGVVHCFVIEECMLAGREYNWVECPSHGGLHMRELAPDTVFADIENALTIHVDQLKRSRMLGRGAFGFVFRATIRQPNGELCEVAQKMLEPVDPGPGGRPSALAAYKAAADKWKRDSMEFACRAYCTSRQELSLLSRMKHPNVIGLVGVCTFPLSLVVELAPLGALNQLLASHRKAGTKLLLGVIKESAVQVARALEYLHSAHIIYRDLKSENVLGWRFPAPFSPQTDVLLKLGDYGISRSVLPSGGAKGFGGTEGFMAPEIVRFNGEEEYTQKVDCFSFGMFLYELLTLKFPFEGEEHVKERMLDGARPVLLPHELLLPTPMLDLLVHCWSAHPESRPSSSQLVGFCAAPEFTHLLDVCELGEALPPSQLMALSVTDEIDDPDDFEAQIWLSGREMLVMGCTQYGFVDQKSIELPHRSKYVSKVRDSVWSCDECGQVTVYGISLHETGHLQLPSLNGTLIRAPELISNDVLVLISEKQIVLLRLSETNSVSHLGTFDSPYDIRTATFLDNGSTRQIWAGHSEGRISIHHLAANDTFSFSSSLYLPDDKSIVRQLVGSKDAQKVWIALEKSSKIQMVEVEKRQVTGSLDIRKVMPGSETIHTIDMEMASQNYVTCLDLLERNDGDQLYIGSSKGLLVISHAATLQPLSACRPFEGDITSICILEEPSREEESIRGKTTTLSTASSESGLGWVRERVSETVDRFRSSPATVEAQGAALLVCIGRQFRSLSHRFVSEQKLADVYSIAVWRTEEWTL